jgi:hypothetical protein
MAMPILANTKHELFAQSLAKGLSADAAYQAAGCKPNRGNVIRLKANESIVKRVAEIQGKAAEKVGLTREFVVDRLMQNLERAMQAEPVRDREANLTGEYTYQGSVANKALELFGKQIGMFVDRRESVNTNYNISDQPTSKDEWKDAYGVE